MMGGKYFAGESFATAIASHRSLSKIGYQAVRVTAVECIAGLKAAGRGGMPQPGDSTVLADSLEDEDDYVIIERAPSAPTSG